MNSNTDYEYIRLEIDSSNRLNGDIYDFNVNISNSFLGNDSIEESKLLLSEFSTANDMTNMNSYSKSLLFGTTQYFTFEEQNYNSTQLIDYFNSNNNLGLTMSYNSQSENFTFYNPLGITYPINLTLNNYQKDLLGFQNSSNNIGTTLSSDKPINLNYPKKIKIITKNVNLKSYNTQNGNNNILAVVKPNVQFGEIINFSNTLPVSTNTNFINEINLQLLDEYNNLITGKKTNYDMTLFLLNKL